MRISALIFMMLAWVSLVSGGAGADVYSVIVQGDDANTRIVVSAETPIEHDEFLTIGSGSSLIVDLASKGWIGDEAEFRPVGGVLAQEWVNGQLVFWLNGPMQISNISDLPPYGTRASYRLVIDLVPVSRARFERAARRDMKRLASLSSERRLASSEAPRRVAAGGTRRVVVIDPGHGGRDPGTSHHGAVERAIVLESAKRLKATLEKNPVYDVRLTRSDDTFIELEDRVKLAREWDADLFISLHADAAKSPSVMGAGVYTLSAKGEGRIEETTRDQNWRLPIETGEAPDEVANILEDLLKRETKSSSEKFAGLLIPELARAGPILRDTQREGNYFVLLAPDVPAVLLEIGFLTNRDDAKRLSSAAGQRKAMTAVANAINTFFEQQDLLLAQN